MITNKIYLIVYDILDEDNIIIKSGQIKVKNKASEFEAKCSLEAHLKKKYPLFNRLVIHKCDSGMHTFIGDIMGDMFGGMT